MKHVILGNGPAGVVAAETLRRAAPLDDIVMVGCEDAPAYSRMAIPYLLMNRIDESGTYLRKSEDHFDSLRIGEIRGKAARLDTAARQVSLDDGTILPFARLLIATGSRPIVPPIPGIDLPDVHPCWTLDDARAILAKAEPGKRVLQVGAGFIGCIIMEALVERGVTLTIVEMGDRMVPRMMTPAAGNMIRRWVEHKGVRVVTSAKVNRIELAKASQGGLGGIIKRLTGTASETTGPMRATLSTGDVIECDLIIAAAGVRPNLEFLAGSGIQVGAGVIVDESLETSVAGIFAAGDCVEAAEFHSGKPFVNAIQPDAAEQARIAALNMAGKPARSQGSMAINVLDTMGLISSSFGQWEGVPGGDGVESVAPELYRYLSLQFQGDVLVGATAIGLTQHVGALRGLIQNRTHLGNWKKILKEKPERFVEAYVANSQATAMARSLN